MLQLPPAHQNFPECHRRRGEEKHSHHESAAIVRPEPAIVWKVTGHHHETDVQEDGYLAPQIIVNAWLLVSHGSTKESLLPELLPLAANRTLVDLSACMDHYILWLKA
jgi:hypothetical protein